jgi:TonB family protein
MSYRIRPAYALFGVILAVVAIPSFATDLDFPKVDESKPHPLPAVSRCMQPSNVAVIAVHVNELGKPFDVQMTKNSGCASLDTAAPDTVRKWRFVPASRNGEAFAEWTAIGFQFDGSGVKLVEVPPQTDLSKADRERIVCKNQSAETGRIIPPAPVCMAKWEWDERKRQEDAMRHREHVPTSLGTGGITAPSH